MITSNGPIQSDIDNAFRGTNFGPIGETPEGRKYLVSDCILKRVCGYSSGGTIEGICKELGLLTKKGVPVKNAKFWAYLYNAKCKESAQQRIEQLEAELNPQIDSPLQKLGARLAELLDAGHFNNTEQYLYAIKAQIANLQEDNAKLRNLATRLQARADNAYISYINACRNDECLGVDYKIEKGLFKRNNLDTFMEANELLGKHRAYQDSANLINEVLGLDTEQALSQSNPASTGERT